LADAAAVKIEDGDDSKPNKTRKKAAKKVKAVGKLDSEGVMCLDTTEPGEKKPPRVYKTTKRIKAQPIDNESTDTALVETEPATISSLSKRAAGHL
jgi:hypothetical protein